MRKRLYQEVSANQKESVTEINLFSANPATDAEYPDQKSVPSCYHHLQNVFSKTKALSLPLHRPYDCAIDLIPGSIIPYWVMPFGLTNALAVFQAIINDVLRDFLDHFVYVYLDDILIYSPNLDTHHNHVTQVLKRLLENHLYFKAEKSVFHADTVSFPGFIVAPGRVQMDTAKVSTVAEWPTPDSCKKVQQFSGFTNFYRRFVRGFSAITIPLHALTST